MHVHEWCARMSPMVYVDAETGVKVRPLGPPARSGKLGATQLASSRVGQIEQIEPRYYS